MTKNEYAILHFLWTEGRPLSRSEIIELSPEKSWSPSSIHILLNSLINKGAVTVDGFVKTGRNYGRTYKAALTEDEYVKMQLMRSVNFEDNKSKGIVTIFASMLDNEDFDIDTINKLEEILREKKRGIEQ